MCANVESRPTRPLELRKTNSIIQERAPNSRHLDLFNLIIYILETSEGAAAQQCGHNTETGSDRQTDGERQKICRKEDGEWRDNSVRE